MLNKYRLKDDTNCYRVIHGVRYEHWTSDLNVDIAEERKLYPEHKFRTIADIIFRSVTTL